MSMVGFPLLLIPLAIYNIIVFLMPGVGFTEPLVRLPLVSGEVWAVSLGDMLVTLSVLLLLLEVIKAARGKYLTDHLLSLLVFGGAAAEFVLLPRFGTSTYFLLALLALVDFLSGIALRARRGVAKLATARPASRQFEAPPAARIDPEPAATRSAESMPQDRAEPNIRPTDVTPAGPSPEVASPGLQPGEGTPPPHNPSR